MIVPTMNLIESTGECEFVFNHYYLNKIGVNQLSVIRNYFIIVIGCIILLIGLLNLFSFLVSHNISNYILFIPLGILLIIAGIYFIKGYKNKTLFLALFGVIALLGLISTYIYLFTPLGDNINNIYFFIGTYLVIVIIVIRSYLQRHKNTRLPWKNEW